MPANNWETFAQKAVVAHGSKPDDGFAPYSQEQVPGSAHNPTSKCKHSNY